MAVLLRGGLLPQGAAFAKRDVRLEEGIVTEMSPDLPDASGDLVFFLGGCVLLPGFADVHVHLREPGFPEKETVATGTAAAARGGFTLLCSMPNVEPPPDSPARLRLQLDIIRRSAAVPVLSCGCLTLGRRGERPADMAALAPFAAAFSDDGSGVQSDEVMREAMRAAKTAGAVIMAHCEDSRLTAGGVVNAGPAARRLGLPGCPAESEWSQLRRDLALVAETGARYHACHLSCAESVALMRRAKAAGLPVSCETAPHYLALCDDDVRDDGSWRMNPPIRSAADRQALMEGLADGTVDMVATDHAPHTAAEKAGGLAASLMGIVGLETAFPVLYTALVRTKILTLGDLLQRMSAAPRRLLRQPDNTIRTGAPLDAVAVALDESYTVDPACFAGKGRSTPFAGKTVYGRIKHTWAGGRKVF